MDGDIQLFSPPVTDGDIILNTNDTPVASGARYFIID